MTKPPARTPLLALIWAASSVPDPVTFPVRCWTIPILAANYPLVAGRCRVGGPAASMDCSLPGRSLLKTPKGHA